VCVSNTEGTYFCGSMATVVMPTVHIVTLNILLTTFITDYRITSSGTNVCGKEIK
jgi:hypothetical protein